MSNNEIQGGLHKSVINWYPGHMVKAKRQIIEDLKLIDIVIEILDARLPLASQNPDLQQIIGNKTKIIILNKSDLADEIQTNRWIKYFEKRGFCTIEFNSTNEKGIEKILKTIQDTYEMKVKETKSNKIRVGKIIRVMIVGIPNVGKSSFINRLSKKSSAKVGNKPGVTITKQWIRLTNNIELLDTPGILWPKLSDKNSAQKLAYVGTIKDEIMDKVELTYELIKYMIENDYLWKLLGRYKIDDVKINNILRSDNLEENEKIVDIMKEIGKRRGAIISGGNVDLEKVANIVLEEFRSGKIGKFSLEKVNE